MASRNILEPPSESWDDDFVFQRAKDQPNIPNSELYEPQWPIPTTKDWSTNTLHTRPSASSLSQLDSQPPITRLKDWAEPGPSTPPKHSKVQTENWDDDFEDKTDSPARHPASRPHHRRPKLPEIPEPENWDDDIDAGKFVSPKKDPTWDSSDDEDGPDFADQEEDKTVTAHPRKVAPTRSSPPPPLPQLPLPSAPPGEAFPGSPTMSVFSIPSGRDSATYSSMAHLPLRGGGASTLTMLPPSPPTQKGRRRLRKKSRPPDNNVFELLDREPASTPLPSSPQPTTPNMSPADLSPAESSNNNPRSSILSRIGSVKRWSVRKRRTSPGPSDAGQLPSRDATPRAAASQSQTPSRTPSWFFRSSDTLDSTPGSPLGSATLELKHERSFRHLKAFAPSDSPTKPKQGRILGAMLGDRSHNPGSTSTLEGSPPASPRRPRRPKSMQVPTKVPPYYPRQASYGARSISRDTSHTSTEDLGRESERKGKEKERVREEGHRGFMSGVRRISLVSGKKHKRTKSSGSTTIEDAHEPPSPPVPQILSPIQTVTPSIAAQLLPPIELQPPSPPREQLADEPRRSIASERSTISSSDSLTAGLESLLLRPAVDAKPLPPPPSIAPKPPSTKGPTSPQSASLGRTTQPPSTTSTVTGIVPRRNSLGDLKIPARISQAQVGLKRDLGMVREFAAEVERLKELQGVYQTLTVEAQGILLEPSRNTPAPRPTSPTFFPLSVHVRERDPTPAQVLVRDRQFTQAVCGIVFSPDHKYKVSWECAELLIELGGGPPAPPSHPNSSTLPSAQQLMHPGDSISSRKSRERAITLSPSTTSPPGEWRGSAGRNDLSQRQLWLLRDMLNRSDASPTMLANLQTLEEIPNRSWLWGEATNSTITLPSEDSGRNASPAKKRRYSRASSTYDDQSINQQYRPAANSTGAADTTPSVRASSPFSTAPALTTSRPVAPRAFPPSAPPAHILHSYSSGSDLASRSGNGTIDADDEDEDEDWDHIDAAEDLDTAVRVLGVPTTRELNGTATVRGRRTKQQHPHRLEAEASTSRRRRQGRGSLPSRVHLSLVSRYGFSTDDVLPQPHTPPLPLPMSQVVSPFMRPTRLSNVEESADSSTRVIGGRSKSPRRPTVAGSSSASSLSRRGSTLTGSVRSALSPAPTQDGIVDKRNLALSLTPETIRPLLENARKCVGELRTLLASRP
ncbi:hypothetical protein EI94DRAFT_1738197 [Lactarius quietus]|nr:hypothetical protein EI94DRAFT_1738197 [Lactarius quietus]